MGKILINAYIDQAIYLELQTPKYMRKRSELINNLLKGFLRTESVDKSQENELIDKLNELKEDIAFKENEMQSIVIKLSQINQQKLTDEKLEVEDLERKKLYIKVLRNELNNNYDGNKKEFERDNK